MWGRYGQGRKVKFFSPVLLACYDRESEELQSVCRCMSGFSDEFYEAMTSFYKTEGNSYTGKPKTYIRTGTCIACDKEIEHRCGSRDCALVMMLPDTTDESPSVWFRPCQVRVPLHPFSSIALFHFFLPYTSLSCVLCPSPSRRYGRSGVRS